MNLQSMIKKIFSRKKKGFRSNFREMMNGRKEIGLKADYDINLRLLEAVPQFMYNNLK